MRSIEDLLSIFPLGYFLQAPGNTPEIHRGLIVQIPSDLFIKSFRRCKEICPGIHRGLPVSSPSQILIKSIRKYNKIDPEIHGGPIVFACRTYCLYSFLDIF